jgi:hypothetical protein
MMLLLLLSLRCPIVVRAVVEILADQICGNGPINEKLLILGVTVLYADEHQTYFFQHEGYHRSAGGMSGWFGSASSDEIVRVLKLTSNWTSTTS